MPPEKFARYANDLPKLQAERSLRLMRDLAAGTGAMEAADQRQYRGELQRQAAGGVIRGEKATRTSLERMGIKVVERG